MKVFAQNWQRITSDAWILEVVNKGYSLEFVTFPAVGEGKFRPIQRPCPKEIKDEVQALLLKNAIEEVLIQRNVGFHSTFFLCPKKTGGLRPILNLRPLNRHLKKQHFKMDHLGIVIKDLVQDLWAVSVDLTDAYLHVPVNPHHWKYLRFTIPGENRCFQFCCLCFGLGTAPRVFTKLVTAIGAFLRKQG